MRKKISVGWALFVASVIFGSIGLIGYSVKRNFDADTRRVAENIYYACVATNSVRANAKGVALKDVDTDRDIWLAIDKLIPDGLPEPTRTLIFSKIDMRRVVIDDTYKPTNCPLPPSLFEDVALTVPTT